MFECGVYCGECVWCCVELFENCIVCGWSLLFVSGGINIFVFVVWWLWFCMYMGKFLCILFIGVEFVVSKFVCGCNVCSIFCKIKLCIKCFWWKCILCLVGCILIFMWVGFKFKNSINVG